MRIENCVPMIALCLLLCGCGKQTAEPAADLRSVYQEMSGCEMTAEVTCEQSGLEWSATLHGTYVPGGESTVEVLEPLELAGVRAALREDGWTLGADNRTYTYGADSLSWRVADGWTHLQDNVYYRELAPNTVLDAGLIDGGAVDVSENMTRTELERLSKALSIRVRAAAVQREGGDTAQIAWKRLGGR